MRKLEVFLNGRLDLEMPGIVTLNRVALGLPGAAAPSVARGSAKFAVLVRLNPSDWNCSLMNSRIWNGLKNQRSTCGCGGPNT